MKQLSKLVLALLAVALMIIGAAFVQAADVDMTGTWNVSVDSPSGKGTPTFVLEQKDGQLTGTYKGAFGESPVKGSIKGSDFEISFNSSGIDITYSGKIEGSKISGNADFGSYGKGSFTGEKK